jgi:glycolate oxidase FAD binding subunit
MENEITPATPEEVLDAVADALAEGTRLEILGAGTKRNYGRPAEAERLLNLSHLAGITLYEPNELVMTARPGTPLGEIEASLYENGQHLAFEPADYGAVLKGAEGGKETAGATIGGIFACNLSGPRRIAAGAARDHILGVKAVSGRAEVFKSGGRVVKNVTGYDMSKLLTGSLGTLAVMTEVTFKVLPAPDDSRTVVISGLDDRAALDAMTKALTGPWEVSAAAHLPKPLAQRSWVARIAGANAATVMRLEGPAPSVAARAEGLGGDLAGFGTVGELAHADTRALWREIRDVHPLISPPALGPGYEVWRIAAPPSEATAITERIAQNLQTLAFYDWGGGLIWLAVGALDDMAATKRADILRAAIGEAGGHGTLVRADAETRRAVPVFQPETGALAGLTRRVKENFDPKGILNAGRMYPGV